MKIRSNVFHGFSGELSIASHMQREVRCAVHLAEKLQIYIDNGEEDFSRWAHEEAQELGQSAFGGTLLNVIGTSYVEQVMSVELLISVHRDHFNLLILIAGKA